MKRNIFRAYHNDSMTPALQVNLIPILPSKLWSQALTSTAHGRQLQGSGSLAAAAQEGH